MSPFIDLGLFVAILLYFSGAFLLETLRIAPPVETWTLSSSAAVRFCILYTSFVVILNYLNQSNVLQSARPALVRYGVNIDTVLTILQIIILFFVPAIILAKLHIVPVNQTPQRGLPAVKQSIRLYTS